MRIHLQLDPNSTKLAHWWAINYFHFFTQKMSVLWNVLERAKMLGKLEQVEVLYTGRFSHLVKALVPNVITKPWTTGGNCYIIPPRQFEPCDSAHLPPLAEFLGRHVQPVAEKPGIAILRRSTTRKVEGVETIRQAVARACGQPVYVDSFRGETMEYQIARMKATSVVVGAHGAELTNLLFMPPRSTVIEIMPYGFTIDLFKNLCKVAGHRYVILEGSNPPRGVTEDSATLRSRVMAREKIRFRLRDVPLIKINPQAVASAVYQAVP